MGCKRLVIASLIACLLVLAGGIAAFGYGAWLLKQPLGLADDVLLEVKPGTHARSLLHQLQQQGAQLEVTPSYLASRILVTPHHLQAGVYAITPTHTLQQVWQELQAGKQHQFQVSLIEGMTLQQVLARLQASPYLASEPLQQLAANDGEALLALLGRELGRDYQQLFDETPATLEGLFFPETYHYRAYTSALDILRAAYDKMQQQLAQIWQQRDADLPYANAYELLIMASIIEKETGITGERATVASVFVNRLRAGMRLQSDPTTIYGITDFDGNLTRAHLREQTAYNTYRIKRLPPTPIAMPSRASLLAAAHPASTDYFYFVADGSGGHVFSKTLAEHNAAVNRYQRQQP
ncbi:endolytic transglycosylase MltG [Pseudidiomarina sp. GXY010]|uniref:Endolytic murein transglycosylase n=1 Tax=Pseudidiomarina fusca TaxID=2965078 RepID=A0ABU3KVH1_9GAMM|nr:endolytic transglycosylase MltG [Pseudidiomarina sp. GXY010]MDT7524881.1 endolytic transglycosylase MltG [Pseudidiomarina sp. GXY010]